MLDNESRRNRRWLIPSNDPRFREIYDITRNWEQRRVLGSPLSRRRLLLTSNPRPRLTIFGCARDRKIAREPFLIYGRSGQHFSGTLAGGPSHNSEIEARFYVEFKGILPMRATRIDGTLPDESSLPPSLLHGNEIFPPDSIIFTPPAFIFHPAASSGRPFPVALHVPVSQFQGSSRDKARVESPLLPSLSSRQLILFGFPHTHGNFFLGFCSILKLPRRRTCWSRYSRECPSLPSAVHFCNFVPTRASGFSMVFQETFFFHHFSLSAIFLCTN